MAYRTGSAPHETVTVPAGFVTDLASIPRIVWSFFPPDGPWVKAAIVHDFLYDTVGDGQWHSHRGVSRFEPYSRREADRILLEGMIDRRIGILARTMIYLAVRTAGWIGWRRVERRRATTSELA